MNELFATGYITLKNWRHGPKWSYLPQPSILPVRSVSYTEYRFNVYIPSRVVGVHCDYPDDARDECTPLPFSLDRQVALRSMASVKVSKSSGKNTQESWSEFVHSKIPACDNQLHADVLQEEGCTERWIERERKRERKREEGYVNCIEHKSAYLNWLPNKQHYRYTRVPGCRDRPLLLV